MYSDGRNSARARSARIRASHDYEATELDSMRRRAEAVEEGNGHFGFLARLVHTFRRSSYASSASPLAPVTNEIEATAAASLSD